MTSENSSMNKNLTTLLITIFYVEAGIAQIGIFAVESSTAPIHIPVLGILSLITAYSLFTKQKWAVPLVIGLFFTGITFGATTLANSVALQTFEGAMLFHVALIAYMVILLIVSIYTVARRENFN